MISPEPTEVRLLRRRWNRLTEIWVAYHTFLHREVEIGPDKVCLSGSVVTQTTHTLLLMYYSYLYSLFDRAGINFADATQAIEVSLPADTREVRGKILALWSRIENPVTRIRHNVGFHGARAEDSHRDGISQLQRIHPGVPKALMGYLRVFFRHLEMCFSGARPLDPSARASVHQLLEYAKSLEKESEEPFDETPEHMLARYGISPEAYRALIAIMSADDSDERPN